MAHRELFRRGEEFVATGYIRVTKNVMLSPGDDLDRSVFKLFHLRSLYARRLIGIKGSDWTKQMLLSIKHGLTKLRPEVADIKLAVSDKKKSEKEIGKKAGKVVEQVVEQTTPAIPPNVSSE